MPTSVLWFRRDLRLADNPALLRAAAGGPVVALFVLDDALRRAAGPNRLAFLYRGLRSLDAGTGGRLVVRAGDPAAVVPAVAAEAGAGEVACAADFGPYGRRRDEAVAGALAAGGRSLCRVGSPYAVEPGEVVKADGTPYQVFTPFHRAWLARGWPAPAAPPDGVRWHALGGDGIPEDPPVEAALPEATEAAAHAALDAFVAGRLSGYAAARDDPGGDATSRLSPYLKYGLVHPRQVLARLGRGDGAARFRAELAWREFYADVLWHEPASAWSALRPGMDAIEFDEGPEADRRFEAWAAGRTGYPLIDAGMRQLVAEGWMHNRVRMVTASFLVKDLHLPWQRGARHFLHHLVDGDLASNNHGWQWVAGTGTDAAPYFRVFNPVSQGRTFDPDGAYVRRHVPELAGLSPRDVHEPWKLPAGPPAGYPLPIVDHAVERKEALRRYGQATPST
ncbi:MAG TPA: deoxyribodipyrimidine photo-lyase [Acidimicrobiales bacterium]|nr:deoxyribodipyrimidine photo-lyase [Acidimicrobiales bacterium]